jgi:hypothetical protein
MAKFINDFWSSLFDRKFFPTALRVALVVGTILLMINHGHALLTGQMTGEHWISAVLTYCVPYIVNIHGQFISASRREP